MLITNDFVFLNFPKTGTSFTRKVIKEIYGDQCQDLILPVIIYSRVKNRVSQHGIYAQIPPEHNKKPVFSISRNLFDRYASFYFFKWFDIEPPEDRLVLEKEYPGFPKITFNDFLEITDKYTKYDILRAHGIQEKTEIGFQTIQFLAFHSNNPKQSLEEMVQSKVNPFDTLPKIGFLRQESLREDLIQMLCQFRNDKNRIEDIITSQADENVTEDRKGQNWKDVWHLSTYERYLTKDSLLLDYMKIKG